MMLSKEKSQKTIAKYVKTLEDGRDKVRKNFEEMDLENVKIRDDIEKEIMNIEDAVNSVIKELRALTFE